MRNLLIIFFILTTKIVFGQYLGYSPIDDSDVDKWIPKFQMEYYGVYNFGDSEGESTLVLFSTGSEIIAQIKSGKWNSDIKATEWIFLYDNLTNVKIDENEQFTSDQYQGEFVIYENNGKRIKCLKIYDSWSEVSEKKGEYELGRKANQKVSETYYGHYANASFENLNPENLEKMSSKELKIMRNEIFARYGYKFIEGGKMDNYFRQQNWYKPQHTDVDKFLTSLEKRNIELIQLMEGRP
ncbi:YARHG domain-containing protein [Aquimarina megaterium]|uniref:YARHG domain-containing protein n=1 Tax=Aquimarina megaterium TaxID=1443666 RepID=UPI000472AAD0|nr:YARHG domain-containing protein [Aquimarina megaterium]